MFRDCKRAEARHFILEWRLLAKYLPHIPVFLIFKGKITKILFEQGEIGNRAQFEKAYGIQPLGKFIRSIVGLELDAAKTAFSNFVNAPALNPQQIRFLDAIIKYLTINGTIDPAALFAPPFTDINSNGVMDVFNTQQSAELFSLVAKVNKNAMVAG